MADAQLKINVHVLNAEFDVLEALQHFSNYMHEVADRADTPVLRACKVVGHIADGFLHAAETLEHEAEKKT